MSSRRPLEERIARIRNANAMGALAGFPTASREGEAYVDPMLAWTRAQCEDEVPSSEAYADPMLAWARAQDRPLARAARAARARIDSLDPNHETATLEPGWLFALPPIDVVLGLGDDPTSFEGTYHQRTTTGQPDETFRPKRLILDVPVPGVFTLKSLIIGNQLVVKGPIDAYAYSPARHGAPAKKTRRSTDCTRCGAPRARLFNAKGVLACRYCDTEFEEPTLQESPSSSETVGGAITAPVMHPSIRAIVEIGYAGRVWPGMSAGCPWALTVGLVGPRVVCA